MNDKDQAFHYHQVYSIPRKCVVKSRSECNTSVDFCGWKFSAPFLPSNMSAVIDDNIAKWLSFNNYFYIMHRFGDTRKFIQKARAESWPLVSISVGIKEEDKQIIKDIKESGCRVHFITVDVANGYSDSVVDMIKLVKENLPKTKVIAGNVWGDKDSVEFLQDAGADAIKVGLSLGSACLTFPTTSFGSPMFSAALEAGRWSKVPVILDGGVKNNGDIARAIIGFTSSQSTSSYEGALQWRNPLNIPLVMIGGQLAACVDAPSESIYKDAQSIIHDTGVYSCKGKVTHKRFYGSASAENKRKTGQEIKHIEGKSIDLPCNGLTYQEKYEEIVGAIQSQISYGGGKDLSCLKNVNYRIVKE